MLGNAIYTNYWNVFQLFSFPDIAITSVHVPTFEMIVIPSMMLSHWLMVYICAVPNNTIDQSPGLSNFPTGSERGE